MAIFGRLSREEISRDYTHFGRIYGLVPVYLKDPFGEAPGVQVRNWIPEWTLDAADWLWNLAVSARQLVDPTFEHPGFMIIVTGEIRRG